MNSFEGRTGEISWEASGDAAGHGLVMVHSLGADRRMWNDQVPVLSEGRRVVTFDLPGHGDSGARDREYTVEELALDVLDVASAAGLDRFDLCGISIGGVISLWIAANRPDRLTRLIACNTAAKVGTAEAWSQRIDAVRQGGMQSIRDAVVPRFVTSDLDERRPGALAAVYDMFDSIDPVGYIGCCAALRDSDLTGSEAAIDSPTLLIGGSEDVATPPETAMEPLAASIRGSRLEVIEGAAHLSNIDQPDAFNSVVTEFLWG